MPRIRCLCSGYLSQSRLTPREAGNALTATAAEAEASSSTLNSRPVSRSGGLDRQLTSRLQKSKQPAVVTASPATMLIHRASSTSCGCLDKTNIGRAPGRYWGQPATRNVAIAATYEITMATIPTPTATENERHRKLTQC